jgi:hypothetical protein
VVRFAAVHMSLPGTFLPCQPRRAMSVIGGRPADICSIRVHRILTDTVEKGILRRPLSNIDSRRASNEQDRFKKSFARIRLFQILIPQLHFGYFFNTIDPQRTSEGGAAGEPDGHPPIGDLDALTDCTALTIVNCPSKKPTAAIFWIPHFGARVAGKPQSAESATGQLAYAALRSRAGRVVAAVRRSTRSGRVDQDAADAFATAIFAGVAGRQHLCRN